jgi:hypothetical protein
MTQAINGCTKPVIGSSGRHTVEHFEALTKPTALRLEGLVNDFAARLDRVEALRGTPAFAPAAASVEADIGKRLGNRAAVEGVIEGALAEAVADVAEISTGAQADSDKYLASYGPLGQYVASFLAFECPQTIYVASMAHRSAEAEASTTMYTRLRHAYERLQPSQPSGKRFPYGPVTGDE